MHSDWLVNANRSDAARARIIEIATGLIAEHGVDRFDINELAARAHCSRATIYRHTGGKKQLVEAVFVHSAGGIVETVESAVAELTGRDRSRVAIAVALREIRRDRIARQFIRSQFVVDGARVATGSSTIGAIAADLVGIDPSDPITTSLAVRTFLALLLFPSENDSDEPALIDALCTGLCAAQAERHASATSQR